MVSPQAILMRAGTAGLNSWNFLSAELCVLAALMASLTARNVDMARSRGGSLRPWDTHTERYIQGVLQKKVGIAKIGILEKPECFQ